MRDPRFSILAADAKCRAVAFLLEGGRVLIFDGERPSSADHSVSTQTLLAALDLPDPAFDLPDGGIMSALPVAPLPGLATGTPTWFRCETASGDAVFDGSVGQDAGEKWDMVCGDVEADGEVSIERFVYAERLR